MPKPGSSGSVLFLEHDRKVGNYGLGEEHGYNQKYLFDSFIDHLCD